MKYRLLIIGILFVMVLSTAGCSTGNVSVEFTCDDFSESNHITHDISTAVGSEIEIILCSNPTTGFDWDEVQIADTSALKLVNREFLAPGSPDNPPAPGDLPPKNESSFMLDWKIRKGALNSEEIIHIGADYQQTSRG